MALFVCRWCRVRYSPPESSELMNKFIDEMDKVGSFEIQVYKDVYEQMVAEGDWEQILGENGARLRAAVDGTIALSPEMAVVTVSAGREPYARSGGAGGWLKRFLTKLSQLNETADKPVFRAVKANVEGGEGDADRLGRVDLLNDKTKTRLGVRLNGQGELDSEDMFEKMIAHYQSEFTSIKHYGSGQRSKSGSSYCKILSTIGGFAITAWPIVVGTQGSICSALKEVNPAVWADTMKVFSDVSKTAFVLFVGILAVRLVDASAGVSALHRIGALKIIAKGGLIAGSVALGVQIWKVIWILERLVRPLPPSGDKT